MRKTEVEGVEGLAQSGQSPGNSPNPDILQSELDAAREDLKLRTAELEAAQARLTEFEQKLRLIYRSRPYRLAWRLWRTRARTRSALSRLRPGASRKREEAVEEMEALAPDVVAYAAGYAQVSKRPLANNHSDQGEPAQDAFYYGSRGVRATDQDRSGPLHAVLLLGDLTEPQLESALRELAINGPAEGEPVVITDCDALRTLDSAGYLYEYIPPRQDWERRLGRTSDDYDHFVQRRLALIAAAYGLASVPELS
jgi:hypothetical protein